MMTIKEAEKLTGLSRASIRFYEAEGLVQPQREKNGYRVYTQENVGDLLRIRLLRELEVSIEEIRELTAGRLRLRDCLEHHAAGLERAQAKSARCVEVCRQLTETAAEFCDLDAGQWLALLETVQTVSVPEQEAPPKPGPMRRIMARSFDIALYTLLWELLLAVAFRMNLTEGVTKSPSLLMQWLEGGAVLVCIMLFEPLFLRWWGTTPGKWALGIRVTDDKGVRLSYRDALSRCGTLLIYGYGLHIPILTFVRQVRSLAEVFRGEEPLWEWDSRLQLHSPGRLRAVALSLFCLALLGISQHGIRAIPEIPPHRGELTVAEFAENFNAMQKYYEGGTNDYIISADLRELTVKIPWKLNASGEWMARDTNRGDFFPWITQGEPPAVCVHSAPDGTVSGVTLMFYTEWEAGADSDTARRGRDFTRHLFLMRVAAQAFGGAQTGYRYSVSDWRFLQELMANSWKQDYTFALRGMEVVYDMELVGCAPMANGAPRLEDTGEHCAVAYTFTVRLCK